MNKRILILSKDESNKSTLKRIILTSILIPVINLI